MIDDEIVQQIAHKIRAVRLRKKLTVAKLAEKANITKGLLSKIENSRTVPSLPVFAHILQALGISFRNFFDEMNTSGSNYVLFRKEHLSCADTDMPVRQSLLVKQFPTSTIELSICRVHPGGIVLCEANAGLKYQHLIVGQYEVRLNNQVLSLIEGDSIYYDASAAHASINKSECEAVIFEINIRF